MGACPVPDQGGQNLEALAFGEGQDRIDHLLDGLAGYGLATPGAMGLSRTGEEEPEGGRRFR